MDVPFIRQLFVVSSAQLAVVTSGGMIGLPSVLVQHFKQNDSLIEVDVHTESWIASMHGIAGIPSIFMPCLMQWQGRRFGFRLNCLLSIVGWMTIYFANSSLAIIIGELFQGVGAKSMTVINFTILSEMISPKFRNISLALYGITQTIGITMAHILGRSFSVQTLCIVLNCPIILAYLLSFFWPESPAWLAYSGKFEESKKSFIWLRGTNEVSKKEMNALIIAQRDFLHMKMSTTNSKRSKTLMRDLWTKITSRDFYLPTFHTFVLLSCYYFSGNLTVCVYAINLIEKLTIDGDTAFIATVVIDLFLILGNILCPFLLIYFNNKPVLLVGGIGSSLFLLASSIVLYLQFIGFVSSDSYLCLIFLSGCMFFSSFGLYCIPFGIATEIMPLRHRGLGNSLYVLFICLFYTVTIKIAPYLILCLAIHGTLMTYAVLLSCSLFYVWKLVPETKNRTLQSIEECFIVKQVKAKVSSDKEDNEATVILVDNFDVNPIINAK